MIKNKQWWTYKSNDHSKNLLQTWGYCWGKVSVRRRWLSCIWNTARKKNFIGRADCWKVGRKFYRAVDINDRNNQNRLALTYLKRLLRWGFLNLKSKVNSYFKSVILQVLNFHTSSKRHAYAPLVFEIELRKRIEGKSEKHIPNLTQNSCLPFEVTNSSLAQFGSLKESDPWKSINIVSLYQLLQKGAEKNFFCNRELLAWIFQIQTWEIWISEKLFGLKSFVWIWLRLILNLSEWSLFC